METESIKNANPGGDRGLYNQLAKAFAEHQDDTAASAQRQPLTEPPTLPDPDQTKAAALALCQAGFRVVPIQAPGRRTARRNLTNGKEPHFQIIKRQRGDWAPALGMKNNSPNLFYLFPATPDDINEWFEIDTTCNIAISIGDDDDLVDLDFDHGNIPSGVWELFKPRVAFNSGGRGYHLIVTHPDKMTLPPLLVWEGRGIAEVRKRGLVVVPPSQHESGSLRQWLPGMSLLEAGPSEFPEKALPLLQHQYRGGTSNSGAGGTSNSGAPNTREGSSNIYLGVQATSRLPLPGPETIPEAVALVCRHFGVPVTPTGKTISPFPGKPDRKPSLVLAQVDGGTIWLRDFGGDNRIGCWITPAQVVRGKVTEDKGKATGDYSRLPSPALQLVWFTRGLLEAGYYPNPPNVKAQPLGSKVGGRQVSQGLRKLYDGLVLRQQVALVLDGSNPVFAFSWRFGLEWCCLRSVKQVGNDIARLIEDAYLYRHKVNGKNYYSLYPLNEADSENERL